jgi:hypothetical protein
MEVNDFIHDIHYDTVEVDLGGGQIIYEYHYNNISFTSNNVIRLGTVDN